MPRTPYVSQPIEERRRREEAGLAIIAAAAASERAFAAIRAYWDEPVNRALIDAVRKVWADLGEQVENTLVMPTHFSTRNQRKPLTRTQTKR